MEAGFVGEIKAEHITVRKTKTPADIINRGDQRERRHGEREYMRVRGLKGIRDS